MTARGWRLADVLVGLAVVLAVVSAYGCKPPPPELTGGCRTFAVGTWGEHLAPWQDLDWTRYAVVDEPLLSWGDPTGLRIVYPEIPARMDALRSRFADAQARGLATWVNWSSEEADLVYRSAWTNVWDLHVETSVVSIDDYAGPAEWWLGSTPARLGAVYAGLQPGQGMAVVPEAFPLRYESEDDLILMSGLYFEWALEHPRVVAFVPFLWTGGIEQFPALRQYLADLVARYPPCPEG